MGGISLLVRSRADALGLAAPALGTLHAGAAHDAPDTHAALDAALPDAPVLVRAKIEYQGHGVGDAEAFSPRELLRWATELQLRPGALLVVRPRPHSPARSEVQDFKGQQSCSCSQVPCWRCVPVR